MSPSSPASASASKELTVKMDFMMQMLVLSNADDAHAGADSVQSRAPKAAEGEGCTVLQCMCQVKQPTCCCLPARGTTPVHTHNTEMPLHAMQEQCQLQHSSSKTQRLTC